MSPNLNLLHSGSTLVADYCDDVALQVMLQRAGAPMRHAPKCTPLCMCKVMNPLEHPALVLPPTCKLPIYERYVMLHVLLNTMCIHG
jgi:hypothetical protein